LLLVWIEGFSRIFRKIYVYKRFADVCENAGLGAILWGIIQISCFDGAVIPGIAVTVLGCLCAAMAIFIDMLAGRE
jgi:hypothetical protein